MRYNFQTDFYLGVPLRVGLCVTILFVRKNAQKAFPLQSLTQLKFAFMINPA